MLSLRPRHKAQESTMPSLASIVCGTITVPISDRGVEVFYDVVEALDNHPELRSGSSYIACFDDWASVVGATFAVLCDCLEESQGDDLS